MPPDRETRPDSPLEWLRIAGEDLAMARSRVPGVGFGLLCFHAQQAAEKATKAVLIIRKVEFPYVHDIGRLLELARTDGVPVPADVENADFLTDYATVGRYPGAIEIEEADYENAVAAAEAVIRWARGIVEADQNGQ